MTVKELFNFIKGVRPGFAFTDAQLTVWLNEIEGHVQTDIWLLEPAVDETQTGLVEYDSTIDPDTGEMVDANHELLVPFPWNKLYRYFLLMSIDLANGEYQRYANSYELFNEAYEEYAGWYAQHVSPANGEAITRGYYISAYQFAARGGYTGTEEEFYEALGHADEVMEAALTVNNKVNKPEIDPNGTAGQLLRTKGNGKTQWVDYGLPTNAQTAEAVSSWLDDHPAATTTVDFRTVNKVFPYVEDMLDDTSLSEGEYVKTNGFYTEGDGGQAYYKILDTGDANGKDVLEISTTPTLYAHLIEGENCYDPMQYGAHGDGETDDSEFVQYALDKAIAADGALVVTRRHVVKNIAINKTAELRKPTYILGLGGAFVSDHGTMFACGNQSVSDVFFENVSFEGDTDSIAVNCYRLYRMHFVNCQFDGLKKGLYVDGLMQSYIIDGCVFTHISDKCIETKTNYQVKVSNCIAEVSPNARFFEANGFSNSLTIRDCCIEGFTYTIPIYLAGAGGANITANYFEANMLGDIAFNPATDALNAVSIYGNQNLGVVSDTVAMIKWAGNYLRECQSYGNESAGIPINDLSGVANHQYLASYNNRTQSALGANINAKYIKDPFRGSQSTDYGRLSYQKINKNHRRFLISASFTGTAELFSLTTPYSGRGLWYAILNATGVIGGVGAYCGQYVLLQDGTVVSREKYRDITNRIVNDSVIGAGKLATISITGPANTPSSIYVEVDLYGDIPQVTFDGTSFS